MSVRCSDQMKEHWSPAPGIQIQLHYCRDARPVNGAAGHQPACCGAEKSAEPPESTWKRAGPAGAKASRTIRISKERVWGFFGANN